MKQKKKHFFRKAIICIIILTAVYAGIVGFVCIREGSVLKKVPAADDYDAIIVLGAQVKPDGSPSVQLGWRLDAAYEAWKQKKVPVVVCGAQGKDEPMPEAEAMSLYLVEKGVPAEDILKDPDSFNTNQNLKNAAQLLRQLSGIQRVMIVTSDYHVPRALALAGDLTPVVWAVPANRNTGSKITPGKRWHGASTGPGSTCICRWSKR